MPKPKTEFWTNVEYSGFMARIVRVLCEMGVAAEQRFLITHDDYRTASGTVGRLWLRFRMYVLYPLLLTWRLLSDRKPATLIVTTNTFYAPAIALLFRSRKNHRVIHLVYDLYPESLVHAGILSAKSPLCRLLDKLQAWTLRKADANVFLGQRLQEYVLGKTPQTRQPVIIPVGANEEPFTQPPTAQEGTLNILYCGNMGYMHDPESIAALINSPGDAISGAIRLDFHANGKGYQKLQQLVPNPPDWVRFEGFLDDDAWVEKMKGSSIALIVMGSGAENILMPSKTYSALVAGQAVLAIAPEQSDLAELVKEHDCGWFVEPGNAAQLRETLEAIAASPDSILPKQQNAWACGHAHYSGKAVAEQWATLCG